MTVLTVVGARPEFTKAIALSRELRPEITEILVNTGQHYDHELSDVFFEELGLPEPDCNLGVGSGSHATQTAEMMIELEGAIEEYDPSVVLTYGDTNTTVATALVASKLDVELAHVEAGLRSDNRQMPEEINRILTDHASDLLFAPSERAVQTLRKENITDGVHFTGDVMLDVLLQVREDAAAQSSVLAELDLEGTDFLLATVHRPRNADDPERLAAIMDALASDGRPVVLPVHPRTAERLEAYDLLEDVESKLRLIDPLGYLDFISLLDAAAVVATDSGGVQKEALFLETPCVTLREETEWPETVETGWNTLVGADPDRIERALREAAPGSKNVHPYGDGNAAGRIREILEETL